MKLMPILLLTTLIVSGCSSSSTDHSQTSVLTASLLQHPIQIDAKSYPNSHFKQVNASFHTNRSKAHTFKIISNLALTTQWFDRLKKIETLAIHTNNDFVIHSVISSPWPFKDRELISCVHTEFTENIITIDIDHCSAQQPIDNNFVRVEKAQSHWRIQQRENGLVKIHYQAWVEPAGYVPSTFFNLSLIKSTRQSMQALQKILESEEQSNSYY